MTYKVIREVIQHQTVPYKINPVEPVYTFMQEFPYNSSESELYELSLYVEPREEKKK